MSDAPGIQVRPAYLDLQGSVTRTVQPLNCGASTRGGSCRRTDDHAGLGNSTGNGLGIVCGDRRPC